jgi:hypothetical protein
MPMNYKFKVLCTQPRAVLHYVSMYLKFCLSNEEAWKGKEKLEMSACFGGASTTAWWFPDRSQFVVSPGCGRVVADPL